MTTQRCPDNFTEILYINFCDIFRLVFHFLSMEHYNSFEPLSCFTSLARISEAAAKKRYSVFLSIFILNFDTKVVRRVRFTTILLDLVMTPTLNLEIQLSLTKYICAVYFYY